MLSAAAGLCRFRTVKSVPPFSKNVEQMSISGNHCYLMIQVHRRQGPVEAAKGRPLRGTVFCQHELKMHWHCIGAVEAREANARIAQPLFGRRCHAAQGRLSQYFQTNSAPRESQHRFDCAVRTQMRCSNPHVCLGRQCFKTPQYGMCTQARPKKNTRAAGLQYASRLCTEAVKKAWRSGMHSPGMGQKSGDQRGLGDADECIPTAVMFTDLPDDIGSRFGHIARRVERTDERNRVWMGEKIKLLVQPRPQATPNQRRQPRQRNQPQPIAETPLSSKDGNDIGIGLRGARAPRERDIHVHTSPMRTQQRVRKSAVAKIVGYPVDAAVRWNGIDSTLQHVAQYSDRLIRTAEMCLEWGCQELCAHCAKNGGTGENAPPVLMDSVGFLVGDRMQIKRVVNALMMSLT